LHHYSGKGIAVIRVEATQGFVILNNLILDVENQSFEPFNDCTDMHAKDSPENEGEAQQLGNVRGISISAFRPFFQDQDMNGIKDDICEVRGNTIRSLESENGDVVIGIDVQGESEGVKIIGNTVQLRSTPDSPHDKYIACRIREHVSTEQLLINRNNFKEDLVILNHNRNQRRALRVAESYGSTDVSATGREAIGCPFAQELS